ncbi:TauD/TfdA family dioxygenase [Emiliania huxleyi CCMP1516]|uniref:TauD/TfdA-like domain-containing protein n=2 Tax=Emiliania huxleyi TaxID=2903 RepID=A0A0D3I0T5_EMIH1|nr:TauD/TfdA family dioxygenase [Emiliania huxleyi CCMP1516]EOD04870.1 TauD/TfdA family dioxygenase [Emiliania huxleyi CCMP1516]|eukprot:XP_005757299.1 TauD/TfdA family dioxygenase [Emiliania huxleyi CCMP1516]
MVGRLAAARAARALSSAERLGTTEFFGALPPRFPCALHRQGSMRGGSERLGAVVDVGDVRELDEEGAGLVLDALRAHGIIVIKGQQLTRAEQVRFTGMLGETIILPPSFEGRDPEPNQPAIQRVTNFWADGSWKSPAGVFGTYWHQDGQFWQAPLHNIMSMLYSAALPPSGGQTGFADLRAARATLSTSLLEEAARCSIRASVRNIADFAKGTEEDLALFPDVSHPMLSTHLLDGGALLYLGSHAMEVEGMESAEDGRVLLTRLLAHTTETPEFTYFHTWELGDLLIWDNTQVLHHGFPYENNGINRREMYRSQARMRSASPGRSGGCIYGAR